MSVFLKACRREPVPYTPIWLMRQAGRFQPEYRAIRERVSFVELCRRPDLACEVTVHAVRQLGVDAAILFADILLILEPLGVGFEFTKDDGPHIAEPVRTAADVDRVSTEIHAAHTLGYVMETVRLVRRELDGKVPLIGFAGAPFTLASYAIEGGGSREYLHTKTLMYTDEGAWNALMHKLATAIADYLNAQIDAGAQAVQLFDSWVGALSPSDYQRYVEPHVRTVFEALGDRVPAIHFGQGNPELYPLMARAGGDVISLDWRAPLRTTWDRLGPVAVQGNLDPVSLLAPREVLFERAKAVLEQASGRLGHVFNLGHGILRQSSVDQVKALVDFVHESSAR
ncbi:MAG: uroporphyrinogen decarboxylase [Sandaracinaceae bacterium]|nr:uroporphyrinogen decarboxylase [Sandaracinaceae bacterium]